LLASTAAYALARAWASPLSVEASVMRPRLRRVVPVRTCVRS
jgi:hypothetical protein